jgi:hypothetical protein
MFIDCYYLFLITHSSSVKHSIGCWEYQLLVIAICFLCLPASFGSGNDVPTSFPINYINKGRWTQYEHNIFMQEYEKYGNNCMQIARVLSTRTPAQIKKHAETFLQTKFWKQILQLWNDIKSPSLPMKKHRFWSLILLHIKSNNCLSNQRAKFKFYSIMLMHTGNNASPFLLRKR